MDEKSQDVFIKVKKLIANVLNINEEKISIDSKIIDDLGAESLDLVTLMMEFEDEFNSKIPDEDAEKLLTVKDTVNYIYNKIK